MAKYKIQYDGNDYDRVIYEGFEKCKEVMEDAQEQFPNVEFKMVKL